MEIVRPFVKWAGGKGSLLSQLTNFYPFELNNGIINKYVEPFVGGGAVTFELLPTNALINDINKALMNTYRQICHSPEAFLDTVKVLD